MEKNNAPDKEFKLIVLKMFTELRRRPDEHSENIKKYREYKTIRNRSQSVEEYSK